MGCDIHMKVQVRQGNEWVDSEVDGYDNRHYLVFEVLAGVRARVGLKPISKPRGLPADLGLAVEVDEDIWEDSANEIHWFGDHSFSWLGLEEVLAYNWEQIIVERGVVDEATFFKWSKDFSMPDSWCLSVGGGGTKMVTHEEMLNTPCPPNTSRYTEVQWNIRLADRCRHFLDLVNSLKTLGNPKDIRLVFGFDS